MLHLKRRPEREAARLAMTTQNMLADVEDIRTLLHILGYRLEVRFGHVHAVRDSRTALGDLVEDERHLFMGDALPMPCCSFLDTLQLAFADLGSTIPTNGAVD